MLKTIAIDQEKCNGCGACVHACHEGAIGLVDGKAVLLRKDFCDGLGSCLPSCPMGAIRILEEGSTEMDTVKSDAVPENRQLSQEPATASMLSGCPGMHSRPLSTTAGSESPASPPTGKQWPMKIRLLPIQASYYDGAELLIAADCTAYAYGSFHKDFMKGRVTMIGCPKLDPVEYTEKLRGIFTENRIAGVTILRMEVPCCGGLERAAQTALSESGKEIPLRVMVIGVDGRILV